MDWRWPGDDLQYSYALEQLTVMRGWTQPQVWPVRLGQGRLSGELQILPGRFAWSVSKQGKEIDRQQLDVQSNSIVHLRTGPGDADAGH